MTRRKQVKQEKDLNILLTQLYTLQEELGVTTKSSVNEKEQRVESITMGKGRSKTERRGSRFLELKSSIIQRLQNVHAKLKEQSNVHKSFVSQGNNPKAIIEMQSYIRQEIRTMAEEWNEMDNLYKNEARKRKSKFTKSELEVQEALLQKLYQEIEMCKSAQAIGFTNRSNDDVKAIEFNTKTIQSLDVIPTSAPANASSGNTWLDEPNNMGVEVSEHQRGQLDQIQVRDSDFNNQLDQIESGILDLKDIAEAQGEEITRQNIMIENLGKKTDDVQDHVANLNSRMKDTLKAVRSADKLCVDIMCIVLAIGIVSVGYNVMKNMQ